jgi:hypothetical protein
MGEYVNASMNEYVNASMNECVNGVQSWGERWDFCKKRGWQFHFESPRKKLYL